jgi:hypothetical protein
MAVKKLTAEEKKEIVALLKSGLSSKDVVKNLANGTTLGQVRAVKAWITMGHYGKRTPRKMLEEMVNKNLAKRGKTSQTSLLDLLSAIEESAAELRVRLS